MHPDLSARPPDRLPARLSTRLPARRALAGAILIALALAGFLVGGTGSTGAVAVGSALLLLGLLMVGVAIRGSTSEPGVAMAPSGPALSGFAVHPWLAIHAASVVLALVAPHLHLLGVSLTIALIAGVLLERRLAPGAVPPVGPGLAMLLLLTSWFALAGVAGETPLGLAALPDAPYSEAFEVTVALPLALSAWPLLGLFPFHQTRLGPLAPVAAGILLVRVAAVAVPNGLAHWQPLLYLLLVLAMIHALVTRRDSEALAALAAVGLLSAAETAGWCGVGLAAGVALMRSHSLLITAGRVLNARGQILVRGLAALGAILLVPIFAGGLAAEAVYTTLAAIGGAVLLWRR